MLGFSQNKSCILYKYINKKKSGTFMYGGIVLFRFEKGFFLNF